MTDYKAIGSVVHVKGTTKKMMIVGRKIRIKIKEEEKNFDYAGCMYPEGIINDKLFYFNDADVMEVVYEGYSDKDNEILVKMLRDWG